MEIMTADTYVKIVLAVVAVSLLLLVVQGFARNDLLARAAGLEGGVPDRYQFVPAPRSKLAFRFDKLSGETWKMAFPKADGWVLVPVLDAEDLEEAADAEAPKAARPAAVNVPQSPN